MRTRDREVRTRIAAALALACLGLGPWPLELPGEIALAYDFAAPAAPASSANPSDEGYACTGLAAPGGEPRSSRSILPGTIALCERATVVTHLRPDCAPPPLSVVLNLDRSGSMYGQPMRDVVAAGHAMLDALDLAGRPDTRVALVSHGEPALVDVPFGAGEAALRAGLDRLDVASEEVPDNLPQSIDTARELFALDRDLLGYQPIELMLVLSDGGQTFAAQPVLAAADRAQEAGLLIVPVCVENRLAACATMDAIASQPDLAFRADGTAELAPIFAGVVSRTRDIVAREIEVTERLPDGLEYIADSASPPAEFDAGSGELRWRLGFVPRSGITLSYGLAPLWLGRFELAGLEASLEDPMGRETRLPVPVQRLDVVGSCGLETATPSPSPSPTVSPSPTPLPSATPSPTRVPRAIHLPLLFRAQCLSRQRPADVILLIDASNSMTDPTRAGRSKLEAVQEGAISFVARMRPEDRAAVIAFNNSATSLIGLSADAAALQDAIASIAPAPGTRIDVALYAAALELAGPARRPDSRGVILLMTDGQPAPETRAAALGAAEGARAAGHDIFVIGVGEGVDLELLAALAGDPTHRFHADDAEAVAAIYREIGELIPCR